MADRQKQSDIYILFLINKYIVWAFLLMIEHELKEKKINFWIKLERQDNSHFLIFLKCYMFMSNNY
jgi:hypothetical protein